MSASPEPEPPLRPAGLSLRLKLVALAVAVAVIPVALVGLLASRKTREVIEGSLDERFHAVVDALVESADRTIGDARAALAAIAQALADPDRDVDARIAVAGGVLAALDAVARVGVYDHTGARIDTLRKDADRDAGPARDASTPVEPERLDAALLAQARAQGSAAAQVEQMDGTPHVLLVVPVPGAAATWHVAAYVSLAPVQARMTELAERHLGGAAALFLFDAGLGLLAQAGAAQAPPPGTRVERERLLGAEPQAFAHGVYVRQKLDQRDMVGAAMKLHNLPWLAVVEVPARVAFAELRQMRVWLAVTIAAVLLAALLAAVLLARRLTAPIRTLVAFAGDLAARRFDRPVEIRSRDELGVLGHALADAARQLAASEQRIAREIEIRTALGRYLPERLVDRIATGEQTLALGGERRAITVLFADVAGFTPLAEKQPAEVVVTILNQLFTILTEIVFRHGGTVDKFIGDCVMAFWGAPDDQPDHAARALAAAEEMLSWIESGNESWQRRFGVNIQLAVGVSTGEAVVGNFGSEIRMEYTAIGDAVNVAARLEAMARPQQILIPEATRQAAGDGFEYVSLGSHRVAGKSDAIELYEVRP
jgi:class 3 adenylate cyclase